MDTFFGELSTLGQFFTLCAALGGFLFLGQLVLQFFSGDVDIDATASQHSSGDTDTSFKILSFQSLTAFFMMFGLVGLGLLEQLRLLPLAALLGALIAGLGSMWLVTKLFSMMLGLQSSGNVDIRNAVGNEGQVYLTIKPNDTGKVQIVIQGRLMTMDAIASDLSEINTGERVRVVKVLDSNVLVVEKIEHQG